MPYFQGDELADVYDRAREGGYGFVASNVTETNILVGLVEGFARANSDAVLQVKRDTAEFLGNGDVAAGLDVACAYVEALASTYDVGVFLNVDHLRPEETEFLDAVVESGVPSSLMVDASDRPFEENVAETRRVVDMAESSPNEMLVEAELGTIKGVEGGVETDEAFYTDPEDAVEFVDRTGCDLLAVSVGTEHGVSKGADLDLRPDLARAIGDALADHGLDARLVVHGSSGLTVDQVRELLDTGVCKLNTNTRYQYEFARTAAEFYREHAPSIIPPEGVDDDRAGFFADAEWSPTKADFNPQVVCGRVRERIAEVAAEMAEMSGTAGETQYA